MFAELKPVAGTKVSDRITIAESASRQDICLYYFGLWGARKGPTLLLNAAVHGNEVVGVEVVRTIVDEIDPNKLSGNLIVVPIVNPMAFTSGQRWDPYDNIDMNRVFPGDPDGTMTERVAHSFFTIFARQADYIIDLHSAEFPDELIPHIRIRVDRPTRAYLDLVASTGINAVWKGPSIKGMLQTQAFQSKIPVRHHRDRGGGGHYGVRRPGGNDGREKRHGRPRDDRRKGFDPRSADTAPVQ